MYTAVIVAALGYFVDVFDILLFSILRIPSLTSLGLSGSEAFTAGLRILNLQLFGLLLGGVVWGTLGDRYGRLSVLYGSIFLYSLANLACVFVTDPTYYGWYRGVAGFGLAGELGAGITLVSELLPSHKRGWGTTIVTGVGLLGAITAGILAEFIPWRGCYLVGAILGFFLLAARIKVGEGAAFKEIKNRTDIKKGGVRLLFANAGRSARYVFCTLIGFPLISIVYVMATFAPEIGKGISGDVVVTASRAIVFCYIGLSLGDFCFGALSQYLRSRRKASFVSIFFTMAVVLFSFLQPPTSASKFYLYIAVFGFAAANWALVLSITAESFGTNIRATATTSVPNVIRGAAAFFVYGFSELKLVASPWNAWLISESFALLCAFIGVYFLKETFGRELNFTE